MFDRRAYIEGLRANDPHGLKSDNDLQRMADFEQLEWDIYDIEDIGDARRVLQNLIALVRSA